MELPGPPCTDSPCKDCKHYLGQAYWETLTAGNHSRQGVSGHWSQNWKISPWRPKINPAHIHTHVHAQAWISTHLRSSYPPKPQKRSMALTNIRNRASGMGECKCKHTARWLVRWKDTGQWLTVTRQLLETLQLLKFSIFASIPLTPITNIVSITRLSRIETQNINQVIFPGKLGREPRPSACSGNVLH